MNASITLPRPGRYARAAEFLVVLAIIALCVFGILYVLEERQTREGIRLEAMADLHARQVADWLLERQSNAEVIRFSPSLRNHYQRWLQGDRDAAERMWARLGPLLIARGFQAIYLYDHNDRLVWNTPDSPPHTSPELLQGLRDANQSRHVQRIGPYIDDSGHTHLDYVVPLETGEEHTPLVVLHTNFEDQLCPTINIWSDFNQSGESFLFRRDGDQVLYLCPLRHQPNAALRFRLPLTSDRLQAARQLRGKFPLGESTVGYDYRGVLGLGVVQAIAGTDWFVVAKLDLAEIWASVAHEIGLIALVGVLMIISVISGSRVLRQRHQLALVAATQEAQTERLNALEQLRENEELLQILIECTPASLAMLDREMRYLIVSRQWLQDIGMLEHNLIGQRYDSVYPNLPEHWKAAHARGLAGEVVKFEAERVECADGCLRWKRLEVHPWRTADDQVGGITLLTEDVTELKEIELALRASQQRLQDNRELLRTLIRSIPDLVWLKDTQGVYLTCNARFERLYGASESQIIGKTDYDFVPRTLAEFFRTNDLAAIAAGGPRSNEEELTFAGDGHRELVQVIKAPVYDTHGTLIGVLGIGRDITQLKRAEAELALHRRHLEELVAARTAELTAARAEAERLARAKSEFLANMSHEIRTPMNAVLGLAYLLERMDLPDAAHALTRKIHLAGRNLLGILNDILDVSKIESGHIEIERAPFQLDEVLDGLATIMTVTAGDKPLELVIRPPDCLDCTLLGDALRLSQVLINLTSNAVKFTASGSVEVGVDLLERTASEIRVRFSVRDTGIGIDEAAQSRLFQPFAQADASTTRRFGGSGLGLVISRRLVELMGGRLELDSRLGEGSTFRFELRFEVLDTASSHLAGTTRMRVLIVEDDPLVSEALAATVTALKWSATQVASGHQALNLVQRDSTLQGPDALVLLDHRPPELDGPAIASAIRQALPNAAQPLLFQLTCAPREPESDTGGFDMVLSKPLTPSSLHDAVIQARRQRLGVRPLTEPKPSNAHRLAGLRLLVVDDSDINRDVAQLIFGAEGAEVYLANDGREAVDWLIAHPDAVDLVLMDVQTIRSPGGRPGPGGARGSPVQRTPRPATRSGRGVRRQSRHGGRARARGDIVHSSGELSAPQTPGRSNASYRRVNAL
ncbi:PAS domain-containing protein [Allochromatium vinosum]|uniref:PAS domain-containing protein n=1 Tax=Allochromatium vinosum TaxID=1049 RepID=UPI001904CDEC|nr:PAS domain-containing protein [Allochromatium vinosum]MBK1653292.1 hypothetical protein [Allochromatium vinosum]